MITPATRTKIVIFGFLALLALQLTAKKMNFYPPSHYAGLVSNAAVDTFVATGDKMYYGFDIISGYLNIKDVAFGTQDLLTPVFRFAFSPYYMCKGIIEAAVEVGLKESIFIIMTGLVVLFVALTIMEINTEGSYKPSSWIGRLGSWVTSFYKYFGRFISDLSSFYRVLKLEKFVDALFVLLRPIYRICAAPILSTLMGYLEEVLKYKYGYFIIGFGTVTLALLGGYGYSQYFLASVSTVMKNATA